jgi:multisubunit Na+/H+ antiporter MnhB subunit
MSKSYSSKKKYLNLNTVVQIGLIGFTGLGFLLTSLKLPQYGLIANLISQIFWLYSAYKAWHEADQIGIFIVTIFITLTLISGIINYWVF